MRMIALFIAALAIAGCATNETEMRVPAPSLTAIADGVWIHSTYEFLDPWGPYLSQGLVVQSEYGVFLVDTAWNNHDTDILLEQIFSVTGEYPKAAVITHAHNDKAGGAYTLLRRGIPIFIHKLTLLDGRQRGLIPDEDDASFDQNAPLSELIHAETFRHMWLDGKTIEAFYPGPGHTRDNIVVYVPDADLVFAGCLMRPGGTRSLGNTTDANVENWASAVRRVRDEYPDASIVIPSHGPMGGRELFDHTIELAAKPNG
ncbi:MAG: subclass B1 metallo-beta-lactamase [Pseudomonadota bacterium]